MTTEEAQKVLDELQGVRPEVLTGETKRLFEAIMKIADERDELKTRVKEQELEISLLKKIHNYDVKIIDDVKGKAVKLHNQLEEKDKVIDLMAEQLTTPIHGKEWVKQYFENETKQIGEENQ